MTKLVRTLQSIYKDLEVYKNLDELLLLDMIDHDQNFTLTQEQLNFFVTKQKEFMLLIRAISSKINQIDCILTHIIMSMTNSELGNLEELTTSIHEVIITLSPH